MALFKCKMCGGDLSFAPSATTAECEYCGSLQTVPTVQDENLQSLFNRANLLRRKSEFDKAEQIYEKIVQNDSTQAEAYWGLILCKFGIEYVEDPATFKRVPTCHRTSLDSIIADDDYRSALEYADATQKRIYESEAKEIDRLQKEIIALSQKESPYDVFICYKETDETGKRTPDSVIANEIYHQLTQEGLKVFYAAISLEDKLGQEYEPCIFAALNSAKVMLVIGTKADHFNAVWVKNEWGRFLKMTKHDRSKLLIPCFRDMDAYELPEEFAHLQAQDMGKLGFINDVVRGIKKITGAGAPKTEAVLEPTVHTNNTNTAPLLDRVTLFLEDGDWTSADEYCEKVLDIDAKNAQAYLGKLMAELHIRKQEDLKNCAQPFDGSKNYQKAIRFGDDNLKSTLSGYIAYINERNETARLEQAYLSALQAMNTAGTEQAFIQVAHYFENIHAYKDAAEKATLCRERAEDARKDAILATGKSRMRGNSIVPYEGVIHLLEPITGWKDADQQIEICKQKIQEIQVQEEAYLLAKEKKSRRNKRTAAIVIPSVAAVIAFIFIWFTLILPHVRYSKATKLLESGDILNAAMQFGKAGNCKDAEAQSIALWNKIAVRETISAGFKHTVGLKSDGSVIAVGNNQSGQCDLNFWYNFVSVSAGDYHTVGLRADGTVVAAGHNDDGQCDVSNWNNIVAISAGGFHTVGLKTDGTVTAVGYNAYEQCSVSRWTNIVAISANRWHTVGLKADGTVVATGNNYYGQCDTSHWTNIVAISTGEHYTVGLKADGTVVAVGNNSFGQCDISDWQDIVAISAGYYHAIGLKADGTVVAVGQNYDSRCNVSDWQDIVAISAGSSHTIGLKADGTMVATGSNGSDRRNVDDWADIQTP